MVSAINRAEKLAGNEELSDFETTHEDADDVSSLMTEDEQRLKNMLSEELRELEVSVIYFHTSIISHLENK